MFTSENLTLRNEESLGRNKVTDSIIMFEPRRKEKKRKEKIRQAHSESTWKRLRPKMM